MSVGLETTNVFMTFAENFNNCTEALKILKKHYITDRQLERQKMLQ